MASRQPIRILCRLALLGLGFAFAPLALAQPFTVSGTVTEEGTGVPLPGVNVAIPNSAIGTATDIAGEFRIELPAGASQLQFSFVGYRTEVVDVSREVASLNVTLAEDVLGLEEVVVSGVVTTVRRANLANSVEVITGRELAEVTTPQTMADAINGKVVGAVMNSYTGAPGGGMSFRLRGITTINGASQPLLIVDGIVYATDAISNGINAVTRAAAGGNASNQDNPVSRVADLNPQDIESIEILKGPSAAAIYGARASNGVVIVTTRRGTAVGGATQFSVHQSIGFATLSNRLGTRQFTAETAEATYGEAGLELFNAANGRTFDYEEELYGNTAFLRTTQLSATGGNERTQFYASGQVKDDEGIISGTGYERQGARLNVTHRFNDRANIDFTSAYTRSVANRGITGNDNTGTSFGVALSATPNFVDLFPNEAGVYPNHPLNASNPLQTRDLSRIGETTNRVVTTGRFTYGLLQRATQTLQAVIDGGVDSYALESSLVFPVELQFFQGPGLDGVSVQGRTNNFNLSLRSALVHTAAIPESELMVTTQAGFSFFSQDQDILRNTATGLTPGQENADLGAAISIDQFRLFQDDRAFFGQTEVNWGDRIVGTLGARMERSSLNGDVDEFFLYPKAGVALNLAEFDFWTAESIDLLKLRLAYGQTGNTAPFGARYTTFGVVSIGGVAGLSINPNRGFPAVQAERAREIEGGVDVSGFDGRVSLEATAFRKIVDNMILTRQVPFSNGFNTETFNGGELTNTGVELGLSLIPVDTDDFQWVSRTSFWTYNAEVTRLDVPAFQVLGGGFGNTLGSIRIEEGQSPTQIVGIDDTDGDGTSDGVFQLGDASPDFQMSFNNEFILQRNLRLTLFAHWKSGGDNINLSELLYDLGGTSPDYDEDDDGDGIINGLDRTGQLGVSARPFVQDASYFKLREVGLYYTIPDRLVGNSLGGVRNLRIGVSANNILTITPYKSYDPEVHNFGDVPVASGVEVTPFPSQQSFHIHIGFGL
jgi:TonB-linked SusC/RagA family outer membrane protein